MSDDPDIIALVVPGRRARALAAAVDSVIVFGITAVIFLSMSGIAFSTVRFWEVASLAWGASYIPSTAVGGVTIGRAIAGTRVIQTTRPLRYPGVLRAIARWLLLVPNAALAPVLERSFPRLSLAPGFGAGTMLLTRSSIVDVRTSIEDDELARALADAVAVQRRWLETGRTQGWRAWADVAAFAIVVLAMIVGTTIINNLEAPPAEPGPSPIVFPTIPPFIVPSPPLVPGLSFPSPPSVTGLSHVAPFPSFGPRGTRRGVPSPASR